MVDALIEVLPPGPLEKPVEEWSAYELLSDGTRQALMRHREMAMRPFGDGPKADRLIIDAGNNLIKATMRVSEGILRREQGDKWQELLEKIHSHKKSNEPVDSKP